MSELPFELYKYHKTKCRISWEKHGMIFVDDEYFEYIYNEYIRATNCDLCDKEFLKSRDRQLDHDHITGDVRNVVCCKCNLNRKDNKKIKTNTGEDNITKNKNKRSKTGYYFYIHITRDGKYILATKRTTLEAAIIRRDEFIADHPEIYS
tara:strand:+ start:37 stop:486 length:450 start_codon:yes stop_codon:yes gene_type:complete